jgi:hypothetical protein
MVKQAVAGAVPSLTHTIKVYFPAIAGVQVHVAAALFSPIFCHPAAIGCTQNSYWGAVIPCAVAVSVNGGISVCGDDPEMLNVTVGTVAAQTLASIPVNQQHINATNNMPLWCIMRSRSSLSKGRFLRLKRSTA